MNNDIKGLGSYQSYLVSLIPYILIFFILRFIIGDEWQWEGFFMVIAIVFAWYLFKGITRAIYFQLFLKKKLVDSLVLMFEKNNFPVPDVDDIEGYGIYLESIANNKDLHPQNISATTLCYELNYGSTSKDIFSLFAYRKLIKKSLRIYRQKNKTRDNSFSSYVG
jgi:hypothetical protein